jgi:hypothetical protein
MCPFYPDPSQRIIALSLDPRKGPLVMRVETLLRLARERAGGEIWWREWNSYLVETFLGGDFPPTTTREMGAFPGFDYSMSPSCGTATRALCRCTISVHMLARSSSNREVTAAR